MGFRIEADESAAAGAKRVLRRESGKALAELAEPAPALEVVHDVRKRFKKVRALLKLVRDGLGAKAYHRANGYFRNAGKPLTQVRDADVLAQTLNRLTDRCHGEIDSAALHPIREALATHLAAAHCKVLGDEGVLTKITTAVKDARRRIQRRTFKLDGWPLLKKGLDRSCTKGRAAFAQASTDPTTPNLHEWRKRVKDLGYQFRFLRSAFPADLDSWIDQADELADVLGDDHDLAMLGEFLCRELLPSGGLSADPALKSQVDRLFSLMKRRRQELQARARQLGEQIHHESVQAFVRRVKDAWQRWQE